MSEPVAALDPVFDDEAYRLASKLQDEAIVYDSAAPLFPAQFPRGADEYRAGGVTVFDHVRNLTDTQIRACAATGGVIGVLGLPYFIGPAERPTVERIVRHAAHIEVPMVVKRLGELVRVGPGTSG